MPQYVIKQHTMRKYHRALAHYEKEQHDNHNNLQLNNLHHTLKNLYNNYYYNYKLITILKQKKENIYEVKHNVVNVL